jgi:glycopeptide antibiotics resistance protein
VAAFRFEAYVIDSSFITLMALALSAIVVSIVLVLRGKAMSWPERIGLFGLAVYFPFVLGLTLGGIWIDVGAVDPPGRRGWANLVPFGTIGPQLAAGLVSDLRQLAGNLLILVPLGFGLPVVWQRFRQLSPMLVAGFGVAFVIEFSQIVISLILGVPYRVFDVDDLMLNTAGAIIGWVAWRESLGLIPRASGLSLK